MTTRACEFEEAEIVCTARGVGEVIAAEGPCFKAKIGSAPESAAGSPGGTLAMASGASAVLGESERGVDVLLTSTPEVTRNAALA